MFAKTVEGGLLFSRLRWAERDEMRGVCNQNSMRTQIVANKRLPDGRWLLDRAYDEAITIQCGESVGEPSRWNTLRVLRVLRWYNQYD